MQTDVQSTEAVDLRSLQPRTAVTSAYTSRQSSQARDSPQAGQKRSLDEAAVPIDVRHVSSIDPPKKARIDALRQQFAPNASIILVGIPRSGKRTLGIFAAAALGRRLVHSGQYFERVAGLSRPDYEAIHQDKKKLLEKDIEVLRRMLSENPSGCVIDCGSTSLYSGIAHYLRPYCRTHPVIHIQRSLLAVRKLFDISDDRARQLAKQHQSCSNFDYFNIEEPIHLRDSTFKLRDAQTDFVNFLRLVSNPQPIDDDESILAFSPDAPIESKLYTHALSLPVSAFGRQSEEFMALQGGGDVAMIHVDEWDVSNKNIERSTTRSITQMAAQARRWLKTPIMVSISRELGPKDYLEATQYGFRLAPNFLVIDLALDKNIIHGLAACRGCTRLFGSILLTSLAVKFERIAEMIDKAVAVGIDLVQITMPASSRADEVPFQQLIQSLKQKFLSVHFSAYLTGDMGRKSQIFNPLLTEVSHDHIQDELQIEIVQKQLTARQALEGLFKTFELDRLSFAVLGANVSSSLSPAMHNIAYSEIGLPHVYEPVNVNSWEDIRSRASRPDFGGASLAQPWKTKLVAHLSFMSRHARAVGAINTLIPLRGQFENSGAKNLSAQPFETDLAREVGDQATYRNRAGKVIGFYGDNSDWVSIQVCLRRNITPVNAINQSTTALIIGAGGMARAACYALLQSGCRKIFIYNRTLSNATLVADHFNRWCKSQEDGPSAEIQVIASLDDPWPAGHHQPTIIVSCVTHERLPGEEPVKDFTVPSQWLQSPTGGAAVEQAYYINTPFIQQIRRLQHSTGKTWVIVDGLEVLFEQAVVQFEIMTGRKAPRNLMWNTLQEAVEKRDKKSSRK